MSIAFINEQDIEKTLEKLGITNLRIVSCEKGEYSEKNIVTFEGDSNSDWADQFLQLARLLRYLNADVIEFNNNSFEETYKLQLAIPYKIYCNP